VAVDPKASGDVGSGSSAEPRPRFPRYMLSLGLYYTRVMIADLRNVPEEQILGNPLHSQLIALVTVGLVILTTGFYGGLIAWGVTSRSSSWTIALGSLAVLGLAVVIIALSGLSIALKAAKRAESERASETLEHAGYQEQRLRAERERAEETLFQRNLADTFVLQTLEMTGVRFFDDTVWRFAPRVNILLGKNGYGKTLLLRTLAALIQSDVQYSHLLLENGAEQAPSTGRLRIEVTRNGSTEETIRDDLFFQKTMGKIPLLAIPDSRFVNRTLQKVGRPASSTNPLSRNGARHFLTQQPYEDAVQELLHRLGIDYVARGSFLGPTGFQRPLFALIERVVHGLIDDNDFAFHSIKRFEGTEFEILVSTAGNRDMPLPIQSVSQGTISVLAIFGQIYRFLHSIRLKGKEEDILEGKEEDIRATPAIVFIDELDAHLHPSWQQRVVAMLTGEFPNVQFIFAAHSPLIVAGCDSGEVSVLCRREDSDRFYVKTFDQDFLGATPRDLYSRIFEIDEVDRLYLEYSTKATAQDNEKRIMAIQQLDQKKPRTREEDEKLIRLLRENRLVKRAAEVREQKLKAEESQAQMDDLERKLEELQYQLEQAREKKAEGNTDDGLPR
jgi:hypothetical protein